MSLSYPNEKFGKAVSILATGIPRLQDRLVSAYTAIAPIKLTDFNKYPDIKSDYASLINLLTSGSDAPTGRVSATTSEMSNEDAIAAAELFLSISHMIEDAIKDH